VAIARKQNSKKGGSGMGDTKRSSNGKEVSMRGAGASKTIMNTKKLMEAPQRLL